MDTDELIKIEESKDNDMPGRFQFLKKFRTTLLCHFCTYTLHYSTAFLLMFYLLNITFDSTLFHILIGISVMAFIYNYQDCLLYQPNTPADSRYFVDVPSNYGLPYEDLFILTMDGVKIHAYLIKQPPQMARNAFTVIFFHGNAGNIGHRLINTSYLYQNCLVNILLVEYRGYGRSQGTPSEEGFMMDASSIVEYISTRSDLNRGKIILFGRSLGGAVAIGTASIYSASGQVAGLMVENTFTSIREMGKSVFKLFLIDYVPGIFVKNKFQSLEKISEVRIPSLFISGLQDELVPPIMMRTLYEKSRSTLKRLFLCHLGTHNESWRCPGYYEQITKFLREIDELKQGKEYVSSQIINSPSS